jgi:hypothetical protein
MSGSAPWTDLISDLGRPASNDRLRPDQFQERSSAVAMLDHAPDGRPPQAPLARRRDQKSGPTKIRPSGDPAASSIGQPFWHVAAVQ